MGNGSVFSVRFGSVRENITPVRFGTFFLKIGIFVKSIAQIQRQIGEKQLQRSFDISMMIPIWSFFEFLIFNVISCRDTWFSFK